MKDIPAFLQLVLRKKMAAEPAAKTKFRGLIEECDYLRSQNPDADLVFTIHVPPDSIISFLTTTHPWLTAKPELDEGDIAGLHQAHRDWLADFAQRIKYVQQLYTELHYCHAVILRRYQEKPAEAWNWRIRIQLIQYLLRQLETCVEAFFCELKVAELEEAEKEQIETNNPLLRKYSRRRRRNHAELAKQVWFQQIRDKIGLQLKNQYNRLL